MAAGFTETFVDIAGGKLQLLKGGSGPPLLLLHGAAGNPGWRDFVQALAGKYTVLLPSHPGFNKSDRPAWLETMHALAGFYAWFLEEQGLERIRAIGFSMGGWLAAEIAVMCRHAFSKLMLVDAVGVKPEQGEIYDIFLHSPAEVAQALFHDPTAVPDYERFAGKNLEPLELWTAEHNRETAARLCWKPYMFDPALPGLLAGVRVPTHIVWGRQDRIVPLICGEQYRKAIPGAQLTVIENCGHAPQVEKPKEFVDHALKFLA